MRKRRKFLALLAIVAAATAAALHFASDREPRYHGKSLSQWWAIRSKYAEAEGSDAPSKREEAEQAIRAIGTNALPVLLDWVRYEPSSLAKRIAALVGKLPSALWQERVGGLLLRGAERAALRANDASGIFVILGPRVSPAVPELTALMFQASAPDAAERAAYCLAAIGKDGLPALLAALANPRHPSCGYAAHWLAADAKYFNFGTNAAAAVPLLAVCANDSDDFLARDAIRALGRIKLEPETAIPALTNALGSASFRRRVDAAWSLGRFGREAQCAVPELVRALPDSDRAVRHTATNALLRIAPEVL